MAEFAKRPEVTVETMGKVHNPTGEGVRAVSAQVQLKSAKLTRQLTDPETDDTPPPMAQISVRKTDDLETKVKEDGSSRRNIIRKKTTVADGNYSAKNKKQGGHGKGKWDDLMDGSLDEFVPAMDENDPLYDETEQAPYILSSGGAGDKLDGIYHAHSDRPIYGNLLTLPEFKIRLMESLREYFDSADGDEVIRSIEELKSKEYHPEVVKKAISLSLDEGPRERELVSRLLTLLHPTPLSDEDMAAGFEKLLDSLEDLSIDIPDAKCMVGSFLARAVVDEVLPPAFLSTANNDRPGDLVIEKAVSLLSREHCTARLERVWGPGDGRPVAELKVVLDQLLKEYLLSRELDEAARCVRELQASHFHHELVKRGVTHAMEFAEPKESLDAMVALFAFLVENAIVSEYQVAKGVARLKKLLPDLSLDIPSAPELLKDFEDMARERGCLPTPPGQNGVGDRSLSVEENGVGEQSLSVEENRVADQNFDSD